MYTRVPGVRQYFKFPRPLSIKKWAKISNFKSMQEESDAIVKHYNRVVKGKQCGADGCIPQVWFQNTLLTLPHNFSLRWLASIGKNGGNSFILLYGLGSYYVNVTI